MNTVRAIVERDFFAWYPLFSRYVTGDDGAPVSDRVAVQLWQWLTSDDESLSGRLLVEDSGRITAVAHVHSAPNTTTATHSLVIDDLFSAGDATPDAIGALHAALIDEARSLGCSSIRWKDSVAEIGADGDLVEDLWRERSLA